MSAHTPGPWSRAWVGGALRHINRNVDEDAFYAPPAGEDPDTINHPMRKEADYDLVTAAPDLLAALEDVLSRPMVAAEGTNPLVVTIHIAAERVEKWRAVVAKARGGK